MVSVTELTASLLPLILLAIFIHKWRRRPATSKTPPPSPRRLPVIGNLHQVGEFPHRSLHVLSKRYGHLMLLHFGSVPVLIASSAAAAAEIMKNQDSVFASRPKLSIADRLTYGSMDVGFAPYGDYWRRVRSVCVLQLLSTKRVQSYRGVREEETSIMIEKIIRMQTSSHAVNLSDLFQPMMNDVVCRVALGRKYEGDEGEGRWFGEVMEGLIGLLGTFSVGDYVPWLGWINRINGLDARVEHVAKQYDEFLERVIQQHRDRGGVGDDGAALDFVDVLLQFQRESEMTSPVEDYTIKAVIMDMFNAGTHTTSTALEWTVAELMKNPRALRKLEKEVREVGAGKEEINEDDVEKMPYLKAAFKEGLRLHAPTPLLLPRESTRDTNVLGYDIARGTHVMINAWAINRDPSSWEDPEEFLPERFLDSSIDLRGQHLQFIPFGAGRRGCPGITFALAAGELALAKLVHKFDFALPHGVEDLDMTEATGISVHKKSPLLVITTPAT
uniref:Cytochrome P450 CYP71A59 n=1 Tax=Salvia miltiorrhiza TaxID=226208 RepID=A0A0B4VSN0_SALMI|nr:cytochrome P450 CYP71A59 [Salvia miltiorrhiza]